ncbi:MAG: transglycosylase SLT domain-containing protein [Patescibacteria group bacterium]|nr:transglycosylase SLT domain-containing protein [Patescibacteria group bacterium]
MGCYDKRVKAHLGSFFVAATLALSLSAPAFAQTASSTPVVPRCIITANPSSIEIGGAVTLRWQSSDAISGSISHIGPVDLSGSLNILPSSAGQTVFTGSFPGPGGLATCQALVTVVAGGSVGANGVGGAGGTYGGGGGLANPQDTGGDTATPYDTGGSYQTGSSYPSGNTYNATPYSVNPSNFQTQPSNNQFSQTPTTVTSPQSSGSGVASWLVPCGGSTVPGVPTNPITATGCNLCNLGQLIQNIINFLIIIAVPISAALFAYAGYLYFTAVDDQGKVKQAKKIFSSVIIGLVIALSGYLIVQTLMNALLNPQFKAGGWSWNTLQCSDDRPRTSAVSDIFTGLFMPSGTVGVGSQPTALSGATLQSLTAGVNASESYYQNFENACQGNSNCVANLQALCAIESSCNPSTACNGLNSCGMMQIQPATACSTNSSIPGCANGQVANQQSVIQYLQNYQNSIPLAAQIYTTLLNSPACGGDAACAAAAYNGGPGALNPSACCPSGAAFQCQYDCGSTAPHAVDCTATPTPAQCVHNKGYAETRTYVQSFQTAQSIACGKLTNCQ